MSADNLVTRLRENAARERRLGQVLVPDLLDEAADRLDVDLDKFRINSDYEETLLKMSDGSPILVRLPERNEQ